MTCSAAKTAKQLRREWPGKPRTLPPASFPAQEIRNTRKLSNTQILRAQLRINTQLFKIRFTSNNRAACYAGLAPLPECCGDHFGKQFFIAHHHLGSLAAESCARWRNPPWAPGGMIPAARRAAFPCRNGIAASRTGGHRRAWKARPPCARPLRSAA